MSAYAWVGRWVPSSAPEVGFEAAESWRHRFGAARGLGLHRRRFEATVGPLPQGLWEGAIELCDPAADLFPRLSAACGRYFFELRPAPAARSSTALTLPPAGAADPRRFPRTKGPDLARLAEFRSEMLIDATHDVVLGHFAETTTGALVGWSDSTLVLPAGRHLPSTTQYLIAQRARRLGVRVAVGALGVRMPLWFLNAVHGVSPVARIITLSGNSYILPQRSDQNKWQRWWWSFP
ncbi:hypothetical protein [Corynebacterium liangguodongii]|uniref:Uncharacterized protein n=1 Tax=Corynebacterium liangguodongii TaxID=2079535 RepID=A0A2S0WF57_9CORY|nr:hypothetical protein [Corynebacterium liangguodongii]AWB84302.1 hypothetical protein C3E79_07265 [Corynebacterium liangguodongii]PWB99793.1 hypothetical protein DF219_03860 [Corynebacterium liangguodongii]